MWTPENEMKPQFIHPQPNVYSFKEADLLVDTAQKNGIKIHGHTLVFGEANPAWMQAAPPNQRKQIMIDHISTVVGHFKGKVAEWDITDELLNDNADGWRNTIWEQAMGIQDEFATAFKTAHAADPNAILCDNEYGLENSDDAWNFYFNFIAQEKAAGVPIDCVGFEAHVYDPSTDSFTAAQLEQRMQQLATIGIKSRVAELDVDGSDPTVQANQYNAALQACLAVPTCIDFSTWGITDKYGSTTNDHEYPLNLGNDLLWDANLQPKAAYTALQQTLKSGAGL
jgi:endo-1,4-beta-xylanase